MLSRKRKSLKFLFFCLAFFCCQKSAFASVSTLDSLIKAIDRAIENKDYFTKRKETKIDSLHATLAMLTEVKIKYEVNSFLFKELEHYDLDRALNVAKEKRNLALQLGDKYRIEQSQMNVAEMLGKMGMYKEAFEILDYIDLVLIEKTNKEYLYHIYHSTYSLLYQSSLSDEERQKYIRYVYHYKDSLLQVLDTSRLSYQLVYTGRLLDYGHYDAALEYILRVYPNYLEQKDNFSFDYTLASVYEAMGNTNLQKEYLARAALQDLMKPVKSYIALRKLAIILFQEGDVSRAYTYIKCAMEDAHFAKARFRMIEISETLPIITAAYEQQVNAEKRNLRKLLYFSLILVAFLLLISFIVLKQIRKLRKAEIKLKNKTTEISTINDQLKILNDQLAESDHVKEVYIGYVFDICSSYINKLENFRLTVHKKLRSQKINDAILFTSSTKLFSDELKEFYQSFDAIFLGIFPNFIEDFNALLRADERITPKGNEILTPELRVFALMRLGINDSRKIALILHYSPQTVYNYKLKVKNKAISSKEDFFMSTQKIGK
ncbi:DUF6377 domain-containing protein [Belliella kenyensis]|uniref:DUF6377 domain-containing protein n=1 Tax=Belliella kenyensis TaxID=1472724 RepID=A0ABV8EKM8_9BACT|nr:DUF6377 domain-containing protein [Belliella kenyensis]MCH7402705.1 DUF6377 domain-containing protein [Belliella kenyensis]MDN3603747.1 DUF6377 domain-containing protein [Belliella kenyensis]